MLRKSKYESDKIVGILLRRIVGSIVRFFRNYTLPRIYSEIKGPVKKTEDMDHIDRHCMEWRDMIARFLPEDTLKQIKKKKTYTDLLIIFQYKRIDPDKNQLWKLLMKRDLPDSFYSRFEDFGQVPQVASLDISEPSDKGLEKDWKDVNW